MSAEQDNVFDIKAFLCLWLVDFLAQSPCPKIEREETEHSRAVEILVQTGNQIVGRDILLIPCGLVQFQLGSDPDA